MSTGPVADPVLEERIADVAQKVFVGMSMSSYIRIDLRLDAGGHLHVLDVNSYPAMFYAPDCFGSADLILAATPGGIGPSSITSSTARGDGSSGSTATGLLSVG